VLEFSNDDRVVFVEMWDGDAFFDTDRHVQAFWRLFQRLRAMALSAEDTRTLIDRLLCMQPTHEHRA